jgi:hypothetical protein
MPEGNLDCDVSPYVAALLGGPKRIPNHDLGVADRLGRGGRAELAARTVILLKSVSDVLEVRLPEPDRRAEPDDEERHGGRPTSSSW